MAAPHVSTQYWLELTKKYANFCLKKQTKELKFASLLTNEIQPAMNELISSGDFEDAKLIWFTRSINTQKQNISFYNNWNYNFFNLFFYAFYK